jgi:hypothetical protein
VNNIHPTISPILASITSRPPQHVQSAAPVPGPEVELDFDSMEPDHQPAVSSVTDLADGKAFELTPYQRGYLEGLRAYAWWKDGVEYVGTCGQTYDAAAKLFLARRC